MTQTFKTDNIGHSSNMENTITTTVQKEAPIRIIEDDTGISLNERYVLKSKYSQDSASTLGEKKFKSLESGKEHELSYKEEDSHEKITKWKKICSFIYKCPLHYHFNFIGCFSFILGSIFFYYSELINISYWTFIFACILILYANIVGAIKSKQTPNEYWGYICYNNGSIVFIFGCVYSIFDSNLISIISFIIGSLLYAIGAIAFFFSVKMIHIKLIDKKILFVLFANFIGGLLFTLGSCLFLFESLTYEGVTLYLIGSILFTLATFIDYLIFFNINTI